MNVPRLPADQFFMLSAHLAATRSTCDRGPELLLDPGRHGVGAVLVRDRRIISSGYNGSAPGEPHCSGLRCTECGKILSIVTKLSTALGTIEQAQAELLVGTPHEHCPACSLSDNRSWWEGGHIMVDNHCVRALHAEENALLQCALDGISPKGATLYTTAGPCWDCSKRAVRVEIAEVVFAAHYESRYGLSAMALELLGRANIGVRVLDVSFLRTTKGLDKRP